MSRLTAGRNVGWNGSRAASMQLQAVAGEEADQQTADEGADQPRGERHRPVETLLVTAEDELGGGTDDHAEQDDGDDEHARSLAAWPRRRAVPLRGGTFDTEPQT